MVTGVSETIGDFIERIVANSKVSGARDWLNGLKKVVPNWGEYREWSVTEPVVDGLASALAMQITFSIERESGRADIAKDGREFLREIYNEAIELGLEVRLKEIVCI